MSAVGVWLTWVADVLYGLRLWRAGDWVDGWACEALAC